MNKLLSKWKPCLCIAGGCGAFTRVYEEDSDDPYIMAIISIYSGSANLASKLVAYSAIGSNNDPMEIKALAMDIFLIDEGFELIDPFIFDGGQDD